MLTSQKDNDQVVSAEFSTLKLENSSKKIIRCVKNIILNKIETIVTIKNFNLEVVKSNFNLESVNNKKNNFCYVTILNMFKTFE